MAKIEVSGFKIGAYKCGFGCSWAEIWASRAMIGGSRAKIGDTRVKIRGYGANNGGIEAKTRL